MVTAAFVDRDGVINNCVYNHLPDGEKIGPPWSREQVHLLPNVAEALESLRKSVDYVILVTNQPDINDRFITSDDVDQINDEIQKQAKFEFDLIVIGRQRGSDYYKPKSRAVQTIIDALDIDPANSFFIGDLPTDIECGSSVGLTTVLVNTNNKDPRTFKNFPDYTTNTLRQAADFIFGYTAGTKNK